MSTASFVSGPGRPAAHLRSLFSTRWSLRMVIGAVVIVIAIGVTAMRPQSTTPGFHVAGLTRTASGLAASDPLTTTPDIHAVKDRYVFNGSSPLATAYETENAKDGLTVGVKPHPGWLGWFAVTNDGLPTDAWYHVQMSRPATPVGSGAGEAVFAVQTALTQTTGAINYVVVAAVTKQGETSWEVGYAHGLVADASTQVFWRSAPSATWPLAQDITLRTDGRSCLTVYLGTDKVLDRCGLAMDIPGPYQAYLEVQAKDIPYSSSFKDFWVAQDKPLLVSGLPAGVPVSLVSPTGAPITTGQAGVAGIASLAVPPTAASGIGQLVVGGQKRGPFTYSSGDQLTWTAS